MVAPVYGDIRPRLRGGVARGGRAGAADSDHLTADDCYRVGGTRRRTRGASAGRKLRFHVTLLHRHIGCPERQRHRPPDRCGQRMHDASRRSRQYGAVPREPDHWRLVAVGRMLVEVDPVRRVEPEGDRRRLAVGGQRPRQPLVAEILRYLDRKHAVLTAGIEVRGLAVVGTVRLDPIVGTDRDVELLTLVAIVIPEAGSGSRRSCRAPSPRAQGRSPRRMHRAARGRAAGGGAGPAPASRSPRWQSRSPPPVTTPRHAISPHASPDAQSAAR